MEKNKILVNENENLIAEEDLEEITGGVAAPQTVSINNPETNKSYNAPSLNGLSKDGIKIPGGANNSKYI